MSKPALLPAIEAFLDEHQMAESTFGRSAVNDWKFVRDLRSGRRVWPETEGRVRDFMRSHSPSAQQVAA